MLRVREPGGERRLDLDDLEREIREGRIGPWTLVRRSDAEDWTPAGQLDLYVSLRGPATPRFTAAFSLGRFPILTTALCLGQALLFLWLAHGGRSIPFEQLISAGAKVGANILELGETWRLLSASVLHRDVLHLAFNTFFLFNIGGSVENVFRRRDFILILVASALGTTCASLFMSSVPSVGSSGIVLGLFGSASVFGYRYADLLPRRYRYYFGGAVLPYALFIIYVGFASRDTDNWGHVGGLLAGGLVTAFLEPRLALQGKLTFGARWGAPIAIATMLVAVGAASPLLRSWGPAMVVVTEPRSGLRFDRPTRWTAGENHLGDPAWGNRLGVTIGARAELRRDRPFTLKELRQSYLEEIRALEASGEITGARVLGERPYLIGGGRGLELDIELDSRAGPQVTRSILVERGYHAYRTVLSAPAVWAEDYVPLFARLSRGIRLVETEGLRWARRVAQTFPGMSSARIELGDELAAVGEVDAAARAYKRALEDGSDHPEAIFGLARLSLAYGGDVEAAERAAARLWSEGHEVEGVVTLLADLRRRLGRREDACHVLRRSLDHRNAPSEPIRGRLAQLRCGGGDWMEP